MKIVDKKAFAQAALEAWERALQTRKDLVARHKKELRDAKKYADSLRDVWLQAVKEAQEP